MQPTAQRHTTDWPSSDELRRNVAIDGPLETFIDKSPSSDSLNFRTRSFFSTPAESVHSGHACSFTDHIDPAKCVRDWEWVERV
jgi:hypothetical protein